MNSSRSSVANSGRLLPKIQKGDALVIGAPGSGKTGFILNLVAEYESLGYSPEEILVLTPQRAQAAMLRDQLALASSQVSTGPRARSITSYAFEILTAENPEIKLLSGAKQQSLIASLITTAEEKSLTKSWGVDSLTYSRFWLKTTSMLPASLPCSDSGPALIGPQPWTSIRPI